MSKIVEIRGNKNMIILIILVIIAVFLVWLIKGFIDYVKAKPVALDSETTQKIYQIFCNQVKNGLKAPTTAVFCKDYELLIKENKGIYYVSGWVDSQNSFGAMIRTQINNFKISNVNGILIAKSNIRSMASFKLLGNLTTNYIIAIIMTLVSFAIFSIILF
ncbi:MAG: hypothetical protein ACI4PE_04690 [Bacilli bacterium]